MLEAFRKKLSLASSDLSTGISKLKQRKSPSLPKFPQYPSGGGGLSGSRTVHGLSAVAGPSASRLQASAGEELLNHYQELWSETRELSEGNVASADRASRQLGRLTTEAKDKALGLLRLQKEAAAVPSLADDLTKLTEEAERLAELCSRVSGGLAYLEVLAETGSVQEKQLDARFALAMLREEKVALLNEAKGELSASFHEALEARERSRAAAEEEKSALYRDAFAHDLSLYRSTGIVSNALPGLSGGPPPAVEVKALGSRLPGGLLRPGQVHGLERLGRWAEWGEEEELGGDAERAELEAWLSDVKMEDSGIAGSDSQSVEGECQDM